MKMFLKIFKYRFISGLKHPAIVICLLFAFASSILVGIYSHKTQEDNVLYPIAIVNEDGGEFSEVFIVKVKENEQINLIILNREQAIRQVSVGKLDGAFVLLKGFSDKIEDNNFADIIEFICPSVTTSAYPVSEIAASGVIDIWLDKLVENELIRLYEGLGNDVSVELYEVLNKIDNEFRTDDIIKIEYIGERKYFYDEKDSAPIDRSVGVYASFVIFAVMFSGEWVFNIKKKGLQSRFISVNTNLPLVCLASQLANVMVSLVFFVPLIAFFTFYFHLSFYIGFHLIIGMLLYLLCICSMAFVVSIFSDNLTQLIIAGTSVSIINILLSSLLMPLPQWAGTASAAAKILPGTYIAGCYDNRIQLLYMFLVTIVWIIIGYICIIRLKKAVKT